MVRPGMSFMPCSQLGSFLGSLAAACAAQVGNFGVTEKENIPETRFPCSLPGIPGWITKAEVSRMTNDWAGIDFCLSNGKHLTKSPVSRLGGVLALWKSDLCIVYQVDCTKKETTTLRLGKCVHGRLQAANSKVLRQLLKLPSCSPMLHCWCEQGLSYRLDFSKPCVLM